MVSKCNTCDLIFEETDRKELQRQMLLHVYHFHAEMLTDMQKISIKRLYIDEMKDSHKCTVKSCPVRKGTTYHYVTKSHEIIWLCPTHEQAWAHFQRGGELTN